MDQIMQYFAKEDLLVSYFGKKNANLYHSLHSECRLCLCSKAESCMRNDKTVLIEGCPGSLPDREFQVNGKHTELTEPVYATNIDYFLENS